MVTDDVRLVELTKILNQIEIREPMASLFNPRLQIFPTVNSPLPYRISVRINVKSSTEVYDFFDGLECSASITDYEASRYIRQPERLGKRILEILVEYMRHEIEESLFFNNNYVTAPKHWGPTEEIIDGT